MFYFNRCLSNRGNQAINLHLLDMIHHVIAVTTTFKDIYPQLHCNSDQYNVKNLLPPVLLMVGQRQVLLAAVLKLGKYWSGGTVSPRRAGGHPVFILAYRHSINICGYELSCDVSVFISAG